MHKITISVKILGTALPMNEALRLMHVPATAGRTRTKTKTRMTTQLMAMTQPIVTDPKMYAPIRKSLVGNMRKYIRRSESLTSPTPVQ